MKREIEIGTTATGQHVTIDVDILLRSGLIVQANSGGGKSWALRRLAEQLSTHVPVFVVDVEGEFASLRERFPFFLAAKEGGDTVADPRSAGLLARKLLELRVSAVFDLFDLDLPDRHAWMAAFLRSLDQAPRDLWGDTAILVDEAHVFAPERGKGESDALNGMAALATRGRKRGFGPIDATQRMGKFNKDVAAELKNAMVGWTNLDIDRERALEALGVGRKDRADYDRQLRSMEPGEFFVVGRAFGTFEPIKIRVGTVHSSHPEPGQSKHVAAPPPPAKIRAMLAKLGDLPKEAEQKERTEADLRARIGDLERQLVGRPTGAPEIREVPVVPPEIVSLPSLVQPSITALLGAMLEADRAAHAIHDALEAATETIKRQIQRHGVPSNGTVVTPPSPVHVRVTQVASGSIGTIGSQSDGDGAMRMLRALAARHPTPLTEQQVATLAVMKRKGGSFRTYRSRLAVAGHIRKDGQLLYITDAGLKAAGPVDRPASGREMLEMWLGRPQMKGGAGKLLRLFAEGGVHTKDDAFRRTGLDPKTSGSARTYWSRLSACGLIERAAGGFRAVESLRL